MASDSKLFFPLLCSSCHTPLVAGLCNSGDSFRCPHCSVKLQAEIFPAILRPVSEVSSVGVLASEGEASCFYHPEKQAAKVCSSCGRFLCSLCEIDLAGRCLCPACLEQGRQNDQISELITKRTLYDSLAMNVAILPVFFWPLTLISAPVAFFLAIYAWRKPTSILPRTKIRLVVALLVSALQMIGWGALGLFLFQKWT